MSKRASKKNIIALVAGGAALIVIAAVVLYLYVIKGNNNLGADVVVQTTTPVGSLSFNPASTSVVAGATLTLQLNVNTGGQAITGPVLVINYDSTKLTPTNTTTPVTAGTILTSPTTVTNALVTPGTIRFEQMTTTPYNGSGTLGTLAFKATGTGTTNVTYAFAGAGIANGQDSDLIIKNGDDVLNTVSASAVTITFNTFSMTVKDRAGTTCPVVNGTLNILTTTGTVVVSAAPVGLAGNCVITPTGTINLASGTYNVQFVLPTLLKLTANNIVFPSATQVIAVGQFTSGDLDGNDCINMFDWGKLAGKWGATPTSGNWDATYDLKGDGYIGMPDWGVMFDGWGQGSLAGCSA